MKIVNYGVKRCKQFDFITDLSYTLIKKTKIDFFIYSVILFFILIFLLFFSIYTREKKIHKKITKQILFSIFLFTRVKLFLMDGVD